MIFAKTAMTLPATFVIRHPATSPAPPSCAASRCWRRWCWRSPWCSSSPRDRCCMCIRCSATSRRSRRPRPSAGWPTGTRWSRCSGGRSGLPIPHTAIIPSNQHRIADKLGEFIETHFLEAAPVEAKLRQVDFALLHRRLAARPQAQRRSRAFRAADVARSAGCSRDIGTEDVRHAPRSPRRCRRSISRRSPPARCAASSRRAAIRGCSTI